MNHIEFSNLETDRLLLRKFREEDAENFYKYRTNPQVVLYQGEGWIDYKFQQAVEFVKEQMNFEPGTQDTWFQIAIELTDNKELIGDCAIHTLPQDINQVEIGITIDPMYQDNGFGTEAVKCLLEYIFNELKKHRVIAILDVRNENCLHLLENIGMRKEGHFLKNAFNKGVYTDEYLFALLKEEWN
ncbi:MAG: GNAT family N-acetyltransferase [Sedimentibacter sp.]